VCDALGLNASFCSSTGADSCSELFLCDYGYSNKCVSDIDVDDSGCPEDSEATLGCPCFFDTSVEASPEGYDASMVKTMCETGLLCAEGDYNGGGEPSVGFCWTGSSVETETGYSGTAKAGEACLFKNIPYWGDADTAGGFTKLQVSGRRAAAAC